MSNKEVLNPPTPLLPNSIKWTILRLLKEGKGKLKIAKKMQRDVSTIDEHIRKLHKDQYVIKTSQRWRISQKGLTVLSGGVGFRESEKQGATTQWLNNVRTHDIKVLVKVKNKPVAEDWLLDWREKKLRNNVFYTQRYKGIFTTYTGTSLIFQLPPIRAESSEIAIAECGELINSLISYYERTIRGLKLGGYDVKATVLTQSHAIPYDPIAKWCKNNNLWYRDEIINIDASQTPELETVHNGEAHKHLNNYVRVVKDFMVNDTPTLTEMSKLLEQTNKQLLQTQQQLNLLVQSQEITVKQMSTLIETLKPKEYKETELKVKPYYVG